MASDELISDPGVLESTPTCEFGGFGAAARTGGVAILPWRRDWLTASQAGVNAHPRPDNLGTALFGQCLVHLQKSRAATWHDLCAAWGRLLPGGRLLLAGGNDLGIVSAVKRLARELGQPARVLANRRHARIVLFEHSETATPEIPDRVSIEVPLTLGDPYSLEATPGVFSARRLDSGTEMLLTALSSIEKAPHSVLDVGCGIGSLGLAALLRWPHARATLVDGDARAIDSATRNAARLGVAARCELSWWDAEEPVPTSDCDLVLLNPPFHTGKAVDLRPAREMFLRLAEALARGGTGLIVANRTLPYERDLASIGRLETVAETRSYKLLSLRRLSRSAAASRRRAPGSRSSGRS